MIRISIKTAFIFLVLFSFINCQTISNDELFFSNTKNHKELIEKIREYSSIKDIIKDSFNKKTIIELSKGITVSVSDCDFPLMKIDQDGNLNIDDVETTLRFPFSCLEDDYIPHISIINNHLVIDQFITDCEVQSKKSDTPYLVTIIDLGRYYHFIFSDFYNIKIEKDNLCYIEELKNRWNDRFLSIAYSSVDDGCPINTLEHFKYCAELGFNSLKTDLRLTKDKKIVLCHDAGFTFDTNGRITTFNSSNCVLIHDLLYDDILKLEHAKSNFHKKYGYYAHPIGLDDYLSLCNEYDIIPYLTLRNEYVDETLVVLEENLKKYGLTNRCIINNYTPNTSTCLKIRDKFPYIAICYTMPKSTNLNNTHLSFINLLGNSYLCLSINILSEIEQQFWDKIESDKTNVLVYSMNKKEHYEFAINYRCLGGQITRIEAFNGSY